MIGCLESPTISYLINGNKRIQTIKRIKIKRSSSSILFLLVVGGLAGLVRHIIRKHMLEGIRIRSKKIMVNIL